MTHNEHFAEEILRLANALRYDVVKMIHRCGDGHPGPCMSIAEIMAYLFFYELRLDPKNPQWQGRDRFILSKGHACPIFYACLARRDFFPMEELPKLRTLEGILQGHPDMNKTPGVDTVSGSLGNGVAIGLGMALGCRMQGFDNNVFVIIGDGEQQEGVIWEGAMSAAQYKAGNLIVFADCNNHQSGGKVTDLSSLYPAAEKWRSFHWHVQTIEGHDPDAIRQAVQNAKAERDAPSFIECRTIKGKNIPYMENNNAWHKRTPTAEEVVIAGKALGIEV
ncbi:MAG: transketolase [Spirochaetaceae bacterium]|jgi:transketolase|nr:transketolase [Spirochaetaceae bacterium]